MNTRLNIDIDINNISERKNKSLLYNNDKVDR